MAKFYVAAKLEEYKMVLEVEHRLMDAGHSISFSWASSVDTLLFLSTEVKPSKGMTDIEKKSRIAIEDIEGVRNADALIIFPHKNGRGMFVEMGGAILLGKPVYLIQQEELTRDDMVFFFHPSVVRLPSIDKLLL